MFKVVISRLRGCALQWWKNYKFKTRKKGKEKVRTWKKLSKLVVGFFPPTYMLKHVPLLPKKNGSKSSRIGVHFNKGSPKSSCTLNLPTMVPLKEFMCCEDEEVNEREEGLNQFDSPPIFNDYGDEEILGFEDYSDEELLDFKGLGEALVPLSLCDDEELACKEEFNISPYKVTCLHQEDHVEIRRDFQSSSFLVYYHDSLCSGSQTSCAVNKKPQTHNLSIHALTLVSKSRNPKVRPKKFDGSFPIAKEVNNER